MVKSLGRAISLGLDFGNAQLKVLDIAPAGALISLYTIYYRDLAPLGPFRCNALISGSSSGGAKSF